MYLQDYSGVTDDMGDRAVIFIWMEKKVNVFFTPVNRQPTKYRVSVEVYKNLNIVTDFGVLFMEV